MEKVSIVIPCYNQAHFLPDAIESAVNQTYKNTEIIVVNDGSHDSTSEVAKRYKEVRLIEKENGHLSSARNAGIKAAKGSLILPLDADDKIHPEFIEKTIKYINRYDIISTYLKTFGNENRSWGSLELEPEYIDFKQKNCINCCSLFKKKVWNDVNGYDENMKEGFEDWDFWRRATKKGFKVRIVDDCLFYYRKSGRSMFSEAQEKRHKLIDFMKKKESETGKLIDVVYVLGQGSRFSNSELKFSLRSIEKHLTGYKDIYIVGYFPRWANQNIKFINQKDAQGIKSLNILEKIKTACLNPEITDDFLFINDDHIFINDCDAVTYPYYYSNEDMEKILKDRPDNDQYVKLIKDTCKLVPNITYFDIHKPIVINKQLFLSMYEAYKFKNYLHGLLIKSMYCHHGKIKGKRQNDLILRDKNDFDLLSKVTNEINVFSFHDEAVTPELINYLDKNYPKKSIYEV